MSEVIFDKRPPIGLTPRKLFIQSRALEIIAAMNRYVINDKAIPKEWFDELKDYFSTVTTKGNKNERN